jgi:hypothetical protein
MAADFQTQLKNLRLRKEVLVIMLFLLVIAVFWIGLSIFTSQRQTGISPEQQQLAQPLTPVLDTAVIDRLEQKRMYGPEELTDFPIFVVEAPQDPSQFVAPLTSQESEAPAGSNVILPDTIEGDVEQAEQTP